MKVRVIEAKQENTEKKTRACAYARVSTDSRKQEDSLENQVSTYERLITSNPEYIFAGVYADQGISGYCESRPRFQEMIRKAKAGEIDLIITKSISRFARNTVTVLKVVRELKELGVGIFFEEQNINTLSEEGEMMIAIYASFAEEESRSMSENNKWSIRKKFERGEAMINTTRFLGYKKDEFGELKINQREAAVVKLIFQMYLLNVGSKRMAALLEFLGVETVTGGNWNAGTITQMIVNEKYKGDCHLQKSYTPTHMRHRTVPNDGAVQSYYIEENHPAIVSRELWEQVQAEREKRKKNRNIQSGDGGKYQQRYPLTRMLVCPYCGRNLRRRYTYQKKVEWLCSTYIDKGKDICPGVRVDDEIVSKRNIKEPTVVEEVYKNGEKHYRYTRKTEWDTGKRQEPEHQEAPHGSILQGVNRPRRTVIKL